MNDVGFVASAGEDLADLSLVDAAEMVRKGEASAVELLDACLKNLDAGEPHVNATIWVDREGAYDSARAADAALATGELIGPLPQADVATGAPAHQRQPRIIAVRTLVEKLAFDRFYEWNRVDNRK